MNTQELADLLNPCQSGIQTYLEEFQHLSEIQTRDYDPTNELQQYPPVISVPEVSRTLPPVIHPSTSLFMNNTSKIQVPSPILPPMFPPQTFYQEITNPIIPVQTEFNPNPSPILTPMFLPQTFHQETTYPDIPVQTEFNPNPSPILPPMFPTQKLNQDTTNPNIPIQTPSSAQPCPNCGLLDQMVKKITKDPEKPKGGRPTKENAVREAFKFIRLNPILNTIKNLCQKFSKHQQHGAWATPSLPAWPHHMENPNWPTKSGKVLSP